ncbi:MAG TPA: WS/DGAT domain-containing protein, partial [Minicystis sp.]|nr:WS/DGAT domain-containing protein [Minicystis sp.]
AAPLDPTRPLWELHLVRGHREGTAVLARIHHALGDGVALVRRLLEMTGAPADAAPPDVGVRPPHPTRPGELARVAARQAAALARMSALPPDPRTSLRGPLTTSKRAAWSPPLSLEDLRAAAHARGARVHDLLFAAVSGAVAAYLRAHDGRVPARGLRALVPVYVAPEREAEGNHFGLVFAPLAVDLVPAEARLAAAKATMDRLKASPDAVVALEVLAAIGYAPRAVERLVLEFFTSKASVMVTDVPGPRTRVAIAGVPVRSLVLWPPVAGSVGVGLGLVSYAGELRLGVRADALRVPDPASLASAFVADLARFGVRPRADQRAAPAVTI